MKSLRTRNKEAVEQGLNHEFFVRAGRGGQTIVLETAPIQNTVYKTSFTRDARPLLAQRIL